MRKSIIIAIVQWNILVAFFTGFCIGWYSWPIWAIVIILLALIVSPTIIVSIIFKINKWEG